MAGPKPIPLFTGASRADAPTSGWVAAVDERLAETLATSHERVFEAVAVDSKLGREAFTRDLPNASPDGLDQRGLAEIGRRVAAGDLLIGKVSPRAGVPLSSEQKLLRAIFGEATGEVADTSVRVPSWVEGTVTAAELVDGDGESVIARARVTVSWERPLEVGDTIEVDGRRATVCAIRSLSSDVEIDGRAIAGQIRVVDHARDRIAARSIGPYSPVTQQPLTGRDNHGGQTLTAAQRGALISAGARTLLAELMTIKSDSVQGRVRCYEALVKGEDPEIG